VAVVGNPKQEGLAMSMRVTLTGTILLAGVVSFIADSVIAETVPLASNTSGNVKKFCKKNDGTFFTGAKGGGYGCILDDGSCIVCGGVTAQQKSTCETTRVTPRDIRPIRRVLGRVARVAGKIL
jgi:hypothetical protein